MQKTTFPIELIIGEDCSSDKTLEIALEYQEKYPNIIYLLFSTVNLGQYTGNGRLNFIRCINSCRAKYIALLEGDDYWTSQTKLQKQVDYLDTHPSYIMTFHNALFVNKNELTNKKVLNKPVKSVFKIEDTLNPFCQFAPTSSILFRNNVLGEWPNWTYNCNLGDRILFTMLSKHGKIKYLDFIGSVYRKHPSGVTNIWEDEVIYLNRISFFKNIQSYLGSKYVLLCKKYQKYFYYKFILQLSKRHPEKTTYSSILLSLKYLFKSDFISLCFIRRLKNMDTFMTFLLKLMRNYFLYIKQIIIVR
jgi:glycosyltransferase involved in cell wall biosynthesis